MNDTQYVYVCLTYFVAQSTPSFAPCGFRYTSVSSTSVSLAWEPPQADGSSGAIAYYWLIFNCTPHYSLCNREERVHAIRYNAFNLLRNHEYSISIKACTNKGCGCRNSSITVVLPVTGIYELPIRDCYCIYSVSVVLFIETIISRCNSIYSS